MLKLFVCLLLDFRLFVKTKRVAFCVSVENNTAYYAYCQMSKALIGNKSEKSCVAVN